MCDISGDLHSLDADAMFNDSENVLTIETDTFNTANQSNSSLEYIHVTMQIEYFIHHILFV